jgi:ABC-type glycerol-3-phosphate transport system substrate-binding protein
MDNRLASSSSFSRRDLLRFTAGAVAIGGVGLLAACTATGSTPLSTATRSTSTAKKTIRLEYSFSATDARSTAIRQISAAFTKKTGIAVAQPAGGVNYANLDKLLIREVASKQQPDVSFQYDSVLLELSQAHAIQPLDQFTKSWSTKMRDDFTYPLDELELEGKMLALRFSPVPSNALYYHKDIYAAAGQTKAPVTFEEWEDVSQRVTTPTRYGVSVPLVTSGTLHRLIAAWTSMIWAGGGDLFDAAKGKPTFQNEPGVKAAQWFQDQVFKTKIMPQNATTTSDDTLDDQFVAGNIASITANTGNASGYTAAGVKDMVLAPFPNFANKSTVGTAFGAFTFTMAIPTGAQTEEAWQFIEFTQQPEAQLILAKAGQSLPTRKSALEDPFFKTSAAKQQVEIINWMKVNPHKAPLDIPQYPELITALGTAFQDIIANRAKPSTALKTAASTYTAALS